MKNPKPSDYVSNEKLWEELGFAREHSHTFDIRLSDKTVPTMFWIKNLM